MLFLQKNIWNFEKKFTYRYIGEKPSNSIRWIWHSNIWGTLIITQLCTQIMSLFMFLCFLFLLGETYLFSVIQRGTQNINNRTIFIESYFVFQKATKICAASPKNYHHKYGHQGKFYIEAFTHSYFWKINEKVSNMNSVVLFMFSNISFRIVWSKVCGFL